MRIFSGNESYLHSILWCRARLLACQQSRVWGGPGALAHISGRAARKQASFYNYLQVERILLLITHITFILVRFFFGDAVVLFQKSYTF